MGAPCNKGVGDVGSGPNSRTEQNRRSYVCPPPRPSRIIRYLSGEEHEHEEEELECSIELQGSWLVEELRETHGDRLRVCPGSFGGQETPWYDPEDDEWYD